MRLIFGLVLLLGVAIAGGAVYMAQSYVNTYQAALEAERSRGQSENRVKLVDIYVANRPIKFGEQITPSDVTLASYPQEWLPEGTFSEDRPLFIEGQQPRVALRDMERYEAVLQVNTSEPGAPTGITARLERGQRAFTIQVDVSTGVSGFLRPGDRVDVYWTGSPMDVSMGSRSEITRLIESGVRLIAIDQDASEAPGQATIARTVTVAATPEQVAELAHAQSTGRLTLSLLGRSDDTVAQTIEVDERSLLGIVEPVRQIEAPAPKVCTIRTRKGAEVVDIPIPCTN